MEELGADLQDSCREWRLAGELSAGVHTINVAKIVGHCSKRIEGAQLIWKSGCRVLPQSDIVFDSCIMASGLTICCACTIMQLLGLLRIDADGGTGEVEKEVGYEGIPFRPALPRLA